MDLNHLIFSNKCEALRTAPRYHQEPRVTHSEYWTLYSVCRYPSRFGFNASGLLAMYVVPVVSSTTTWHCTAYSELASLHSQKDGSARTLCVLGGGRRWVEKDGLMCSEHHTAVSTRAFKLTRVVCSTPCVRTPDETSSVEKTPRRLSTHHHHRPHEAISPRCRGIWGAVGRGVRTAT